MSDAATRPAHGPGSGWDTPEAVGRVESAYRADDVTRVRTAQIDLLGPVAGLFPKLDDKQIAAEIAALEERSKAATGA